MSAHICCGRDGCLLPWGHAGPCAPRPPLHVAIRSGVGGPGEVPVDVDVLPPAAWGLRRVRWTVTVVIEEDTSS